jgi:hypothetical protein
MSRTKSRQALAMNADALANAERLLLQYPDVSETERDEIGAFLKNGAPIDIGLLSSNAEAWQNAERFKRDHPRYFAVGRGFLLYCSAVVALLLFALFLMKDIGLN